MERHFDEELKQLKEKLLEMSNLVEKSISDSIKAVMERDCELANKVIRADDTINTLEIEIEEFCLRLLALHQPQAGDLRRITSTMRINNDLERIGDLAVNIAERSLDLLKVTLPRPLVDIPKMAHAAQSMLRDSLDAFVNKDSKLAHDVCKRDDEVDDLNEKIIKNFLISKERDETVVERVIDLVLVTKNIERIADHSTNICEDIIYMVDGKIIKHHIDD